MRMDWKDYALKNSAVFFYNNMISEEKLIKKIKKNNKEDIEKIIKEMIDKKESELSEKGKFKLLDKWLAEIDFLWHEHKATEKELIELISKEISEKINK